MGVRISAMTPEATPDGTELIPASVAGAPRSITTAVLKGYVVDQIEAIGSVGVVEAADGIYILDSTDSALKPVATSVVAQHVIDQVWGKADEPTPDGADVLALKDGGSTEKTVTLTNLAEYVRSAIEAAILDVSDLADGSGTLATTDYMLVTQGTTGKQVTLQDIYDAIYTGLAAHVTGKSSAGTVQGTDELYVVRGGTAYKTTAAAIATYVATQATLSGTGTTDYLASWTDSTTIGATYNVTESTPGFTAGNDTSVPTTKAVEDRLAAIINDQTAIGAALVDADTVLVDDGGAGTQRKATMAEVLAYMRESTKYKTAWVPAALMRPTTTAGSAALAKNEYATNDINLDYLAFAGAAADEHAEFDLVMPAGWDLGTIKFKVFWTNATGASPADDVSFYMAAGALSDDDAIDAALGTLQLVTDAVTADSDMHVSPASPALTVGGTPALGDLIHFKLSRDYDYGGTPMVEDAWVFGVLIQYVEDQAVAAW
jgi:hypothetical protein